MDFDKEMLKLHQRVNRNEGIVGWYVKISLTSYRPSTYCYNSVLYMILDFSDWGPFTHSPSQVLYVSDCQCY